MEFDTNQTDSASDSVPERKYATKIPHTCTGTKDTPIPIYLQTSISIPPIPVQFNFSLHAFPKELPFHAQQSPQVPSNTYAQQSPQVPSDTSFHPHPIPTFTTHK